MQNYMNSVMKNVLVTGGAGFIGSNFIRLLIEKEPALKIINLDLLTYAGHLENLSGIKSENYYFELIDIRDEKKIKRIIHEHEIDTIVHFAAESHVDKSIVSPDQFIQTNIVGTFNLLQAAKEYWSKFGGYVNKRFHHVSTDEVFGMLGLDDPAFSENTPYAPNSPYAASKASSDHLVRSYFHTYGLPISITNCSNNYGPYQYPEKLIPLMILNAINGKKLPVYGKGDQIRDWLFVEDHCDAIYSVLKNGTTGETYNVGGNNRPTNLSIVKQICQILDELFPNSPFLPHDQLIEFVSDRLGHDFRYDMDFTKIKNELGWRPRQTLKNGLRKTVKWYIENKTWIEKITGTSAFEDWMIKKYQSR